MNNNPSSHVGTARRQHAILQLVREARVRSQGELARLLRGRGMPVAQPTLSRDLRQLGLAKTPSGYVAPEGPMLERTPSAARGGKLARTLRSFALSVRVAGSLVIVKTPPAGAQPVARALDETPFAEIAGTIAGDDTVFVATPSERAARALERRLAALGGERERRRPA
jgi:transcriptional regulator of arginine metabolism